jgi:MOSC domain-containing protein YiiM
MSAATGKILAVSVSERKGVRKTNVESARLIENWGIEGDAHAGPGHRQVSLLAQESIAKMRAKGLDVNAGDFAENITTAGIDLTSLPIGARLRIGGAEVEITQIGKECHSRCAIYYQAGDCVMPREGVFARVTRGGEVQPGDQIVLIEEGNGAVESPSGQRAGGSCEIPYSPTIPSVFVRVRPSHALIEPAKEPITQDPQRAGRDDRMRKEGRS